MFLLVLFMIRPPANGGAALTHGHLTALQCIHDLMEGGARFETAQLDIEKAVGYTVLGVAMFVPDSVINDCQALL
uniref:Uncharacterized protein n=1 Tax=Hippocampus comes TaxID=109280 RepID=A0A3Q2Y238_HIPCM